MVSEGHCRNCCLLSWQNEQVTSLGSLASVLPCPQEGTTLTPESLLTLPLSS